MRIAVIGGGVSGIVAAAQLYAHHDVTLFEAEERLGGHTNTVVVERDSGTWALDTGFIVLNDRTYPRFTELLDRAGVARTPTHMAFSIKAEDQDFEYSGTPRGVFAQRANLARLRFWRMLADLLRFNRALANAQGAEEHRSLGEFLVAGGYSGWFIDRLIVPQVSAVWSGDPAVMWSLPVRFLAAFFANHGMLAFTGRPRWQTVRGGSQTYVRAFTAGWDERRIRLSCPVRELRRVEDGVLVQTRGSAEPERFDRAILACHADDALSMLTDPSDGERELLGAFPYQRSEAVLHSDSTLLPRRAAARAAWNYHLFAHPRPMATVTYWLNKLQRLDAPEDFCVTLNLRERIDPRLIIETISYSHPVFTAAGIAAQRRWREISSAGVTRYCGAYWGWGFHEDGVTSALRAVEGWV
jgi:predicted NAD/FAD-binding protein